MRGIVLVGLLASASCREVFGLDDPMLAPVDGFVVVDPGLREHILPGYSLWTSHETPEAAWQPTMGTYTGLSTSIWSGTGPTVLQLQSSGVNVGAQFSVWMDGEIYADAPRMNLSLSADEFAFLDLSIVNGDYDRILEATVGESSSETIALSVGRWYKVRIGWSNISGSQSFSLAHSSDDNPGFVPFTSGQLRFTP